MAVRGGTDVRADVHCGERMPVHDMVSGTRSTPGQALLMQVYVQACLLDYPAGLLYTRAMDRARHADEPSWETQPHTSIAVHGAAPIATLATTAPAASWCTGGLLCNPTTGTVSTCLIICVGTLSTYPALQGVSPATVAEWTLQGSAATFAHEEPLAFILCLASLIGGFNIPMEITNNPKCSIAECPVDPNSLCPGALNGPRSSTGGAVDCQSSCDARLNGDKTNSPDCYTGSSFKGNCPDSYAYAFDEWGGRRCGSCDVSDTGTARHASPAALLRQMRQRREERWLHSKRTAQHDCGRSERSPRRWSPASDTVAICQRSLSRVESGDDRGAPAVRISPSRCDGCLSGPQMPSARQRNALVGMSVSVGCLSGFEIAHCTGLPIDLAVDRLASAVGRDYDILVGTTPFSTGEAMNQGLEIAAHQAGADLSGSLLVDTSFGDSSYQKGRAVFSG
ncbi:hypothetical protein WOLCODRAFT_167452 [Wolfiporia cocos MD-104 SS10]|uniref:Uncharacterized protein n=1 Tax=Wolfiporia cocos (strain MD-104) TaxID=742152 RepID=A0A2H3JL58_WOLCO|nr:hypothetical protein WOLCODRAFT_167452 [Wolfiporia cocos MD-104 SS10]